MATVESVDALLQLAQRAALEAGALIIQGMSHTKQVEHKSAFDLVTSIDRESEKHIVRLVRERCPMHSIVAEEETRISDHDSSYQWIIDPLDGTTNFVHGYPHFAVSIAVAYENRIVVGVVHDPAKHETFTAIRGRGAFLNDEPIRTSNVEKIDKALLATGFPYDRRENADEYLATFKRFMCRAQGIRRGGSASLDLCYVASGRLDGFWERKLHAWDVAAGSLMAREAGGKVTSYSGDELDIWGQEILCSNGRIHEEMVAAAVG